MEVHHHPHLEKKKFKEYFLEFLMIFLAVTLGFFAENLRETIKDNREVREDIQSVVTDLESDIAHFDAILNTYTYSYTSVDSLLNLLHNNISNTPQIYLYARATTANVGNFYTNSKTFDQMKASGILKLLHPRNLLDSLSLYYVTFQFLTQQDNLVKLKLDAVHKDNHLLFDNYVFSQMKIVFDSINKSHTIVERPEGNPPLLSTDYKAVNRVALNYYYLAATEKFDCILADRQKTLALSLIALIKKEYHPK
ncbi:MAG TPA: hypothetical protein VGI82_14700 [Chitinophagaceae bacterium]|jgi:hypothetical protein